jgi:hypothetical protein
MFKSVLATRTALAALVFGIAAGFGSLAFANGSCQSCHVICEETRQACVAGGGGGNCFRAYRVCVEECARNYYNCPIP